MTPRFEVGEICILQHAAQYNGLEVMVVGALCWRPILRLNGIVERCECYVVDLCGEGRAAAPFQLRKRRPPREDLAKVSWRSCPWKPSAVKA
jgi:hypothetical protein